MNNITEVIVNIVLVSIPVIAATIGKYLVQNKKAATLISVLAPLAKDAVIAAQATGAATYLSGVEKKLQAIKDVRSALDKLGFKQTDGYAIANAVEKAFAELSDDIKATYPQVEKPVETPETKPVLTDEQIKAAQDAAVKAVKEA